MNPPSGNAHTCMVSDRAPVTSIRLPHNRAATLADVSSARSSAHVGAGGFTGAASTGARSATASETPITEAADIARTRGRRPAPNLMNTRERQAADTVTPRCRLTDQCE
ncbi:hypothetical protein GCM10009827_114750 [Dactylosporangium maewongense]|uniref:Uncharacterized protein n=1 Tax=Dactylosporangium maewongense TaxID=634393 RepID=A0ABN2DAT6_9ACTN